MPCWAYYVATTGDKLSRCFRGGLFTNRSFWGWIVFRAYRVKPGPLQGEPVAELHARPRGCRWVVQRACQAVERIEPPPDSLSDRRWGIISEDSNYGTTTALEPTTGMLTVAPPEPTADGRSRITSAGIIGGALNHPLSPTAEQTGEHGWGGSLAAESIGGAPHHDNRDRFLGCIEKKNRKRPQKCSRTGMGVIMSQENLRERKEVGGNGHGPFRRRHRLQTLAKPSSF